MGEGNIKTLCSHSTCCENE